MLYSDGRRPSSDQGSNTNGFHPFQGSALFGPFQPTDEEILTLPHVSIPFREVLYSDSSWTQRMSANNKGGFPSLSGKCSIRTPNKASWFSNLKMIVSIPFREVLYSDSQQGILVFEPENDSFHPFQGSALFGHHVVSITSGNHVYTFPSLSGKCSIRTVCRRLGCIRARRPVSIPFREVLYSDILVLLMK